MTIVASINPFYAARTGRITAKRHERKVVFEQARYAFIPDEAALRP